MLCLLIPVFSFSPRQERFACFRAKKAEEQRIQLVCKCESRSKKATRLISDLLLLCFPSVGAFFLWMTQFLQRYSPMNLEYKVEFDPRGLVITGKTTCTKFSHKACCQDPREQRVLFQMKVIRWVLLLRAAIPVNQAAAGEATSAGLQGSLCIGFLERAGSDYQKTTCKRFSLMKGY